MAPPSRPGLAPTGGRTPIPGNSCACDPRFAGTCSKPEPQLNRTSSMKQPVRVTVTGAAGQIGYALLFRIAAGNMLGSDQPVILQLLDITPALGALNGVKMELDDCAFPLLADVVCTDDPKVAFKDADYALLLGARPRGPGMERKD